MLCQMSYGPAHAYIKSLLFYIILWQFALHVDIFIKNQFVNTLHRLLFMELKQQVQPLVY